MLEGYFYTFLWAMTPLLELRASVPLGNLQFGLTIWEAGIISVIGNIIAGAIVLALLPWGARFCEKHIPFADRILKKIFERTQSRHSHKMEVVGEIALILFVAVPLPGSGAWTGALVSYLFGVKYRKAVWLIFLGLILSAIIVSLVTVSGSEIWEFLNS